MTAPLCPVTDRFWSKVDRRGPDDCWHWTSTISGSGYGQFFLAGLYRPASQVAWELANGRSFPKGMLACHSCDNPPCVNPAHIFPGTVLDNALDAKAKGRLFHPTGERHPGAILTDAAVREIRASRDSHRVLADRFGVAVKTIGHITQRRLWRHVV